MEENKNFKNIQEESALDHVVYADDSKYEEDNYAEEYNKLYAPLKKYNSFSLVLKAISLIVLIVAFSFGLALILIAYNEQTFLTMYWGIGIIISSIVFFLFFYALGEIISILHDIRNNQ